ncbi:MAG: sulfatase-like hydrolase/transferase [Bacteroidaceae bacterium]|nr:sulfatase-like hydrolase/transferase [Bacteroidaceae bacterium]
MAYIHTSPVFRTPFMVMLRNLVVVYAAFLICHPVFIWYNWSSFQGDLAGMLWPMLKGALVFDTAGIMYISALYMVLMMFPFHFKEKRWYYILTKIILVVMASAGILMNLVDTVYFPYTGCRSTLQVLDEFSGEGGGQMTSIILRSLADNWYLVLLFVVMVLLLCKFIKIPATLQYRKPFVYYIVRTCCLLLSAVCILAGIRGGLAHNIRPITMSNAYQYVKTPAQAAAILNTPFCVIRTLGNEDMKVPAYFSEEELESIYTPVVLPDSTATFRPLNVVVLILESFGSEYIGAMNQGTQGIHDCAPFMDTLINRSLTFETSLANGRKSIDAMPSVLSGIPMLKDHLFLTPTIMSKEISGLAKELGTKGYYSAFFHGADNGSMGFQSFSRVIGYDDYFGMEDFVKKPEYGGDAVFDGFWAIWDEEFLQYMCDMIGTFKEPFLASAFTASSHHPYNVPERYQSKYPVEGNLPIYRGIRYSDNALKLFFEKASRQPWFNNTLFVLTADHTNLSEHPDYQSDYGNFRVPVIFYCPSDSLMGKRNAIAQQSDIYPSILGYLGYDKPVISFGQNLFGTPDEETWGATFQNGLYSYYMGDYLLQFDGENETGLFTYKSDPTLKRNIKDSQSQTEQEMLKKLKALIQQYIIYMTSK